MPEISAAAVKALRDKTQLPMMDCKRALQEANGDQEKAIRCLREQGRKTMVARSGRATNAGRIAIYTSMDPGVGAMVELQCESAPVAAHDDFRQLADDLARQLAVGPGARTPEALWDQPSPSHEGLTLAEQRDEIANRIRETFRLARLVRIDAPCGGYLHHTAADGVLLVVSAGSPESAKEISMHIAAMRPQVINKEDLDPVEIKKEREILTKQARAEGKPEKIIEKMVDGRMRNFFAERVLVEQPYVKDENVTVGKFAKANGVTPVRFLHWQLGRTT